MVPGTSPPNQTPHYTRIRTNMCTADALTNGSPTHRYTTRPAPKNPRQTPQTLNISSAHVPQSRCVANLDVWPMVQNDKWPNTSPSHATYQITVPVAPELPRDTKEYKNRSTSRVTTNTNTTPPPPPPTTTTTTTTHDHLN